MLLVVWSAKVHHYFTAVTSCITCLVVLPASNNAFPVSTLLTLDMLHGTVHTSALGTLVGALDEKHLSEKLDPERCRSHDSPS